MKKTSIKAAFILLICLLFIPMIVVGCSGSSDDGGGASPTSSPTITPTASPTETPVGYGTVEITAKDFETEKVISGVTVTIAGITGETDAAGKCILNNVTAGNQIINATATGYSGFQDSITVVADETVQKEIFLSPTDIPTPEAGKGNIVGYVKNSSGNGISRVICTLSPKGKTVRDTTLTDTNGRYLFLNIQPGNYNISFSLTNYSFSSVSVTVTANNNTVSPESDGVYNGGGGGEVTYGNINGTVTDSDSLAGVPNALVTVYQGNGLGSKFISYTQFTYTFTDSNGNYTFVGLPFANYKITIEKQGLYLPVDKTTSISSGNVTSTVNAKLAWKYKFFNPQMYCLYFVNNTTGWFAGANGKIVKTTNNLVTYTNQTSGTTEFLTGMHFIDANTGWICGYSGTIVKTTNGGTNWNAQVSGTTKNLWSVYFTDANNGWAVGEGGTILRTTNGGTNWTVQTSGTGIALRSVYFSDSNTGWAVGKGGTILYTTNGGTTWATQSSGTTRDLNCVRFVSSTRGWAVGSYGTILFTDNGGTTWTAQASGKTQTLYTVSFYDSTHGIAAGADTLRLTTSNAGTTWAGGTGAAQNPITGIQLFDADTGFYAANYYGSSYGGGIWSQKPFGNSFFSVTFTNANVGLAVGENGIIYKTTDAGETWVKQAEVGGNLYSVTFADILNCHSVGDTVNTVFYSVDGGANWLNRFVANPQILLGVKFTDVNNGWAIGYNGTIFNTGNGGLNWNSQIAGTINTLYDLSFINANTGWISCQLGTVLKTTNGGGLWNPIATGFLQDLRGICFIDANNGWAVGDEGRILRTLNGGANWVSQTSGTSQMLLRVFFVDANNGWVSGYQGTVLDTTDGGATWTQQTGWDNATGYRGLFFTDVNTGFIAGDRGILKTTTGGR